MSVAGILKNTYIPENNGRVYNVDAIDEIVEKIGEDIEDAVEELEEKIGDVEAEVAKVDAKVAVVDGRVDHLESLGQITKPGVFNTKALLPANVSGFAIAPTINDFTFVKADETNGGKTALYLISNIDDGESGGTAGAITWEFLKTFDADMTGKIDVVSTATEDTIAVFNNVGGVKAQPIKIVDLMWEFEALEP